MRIKSSVKQEENLLANIIQNAQKKGEMIFFLEIDENTVFVYKPITRLEYKRILTNPELDTIEDKKDEICKKCLLWPSDFDFDSCRAGIPEMLANDILEKSCIDVNSMISLIELNRVEMTEISNQMSCIISEAFPAYTIDQIESWNMYKFTEMYTKAEWKLSMFKNFSLDEDIVSSLRRAAGQNDQQQKEDESIEEAPKVINENRNDSFDDKKHQVSNINKNNNARGMSKEEYDAYCEFAKKFPDIRMDKDAAFTGGESIKVDTLPPALRPGWG